MVKASKQLTKHNQLRRLLNQKIKEVSEEAIQAEGNIPEDKIKSVEQLAQLVAIHKTTEPSTPRNRWPVIIVLAVTLIIVSLLLFARVSSTEIELDLSLSGVKFRLPEQQVLTDEVSLASLGVAGLQEIQLPRSQTRDANVFQTPEPSGSVIRLMPVANDSQESTVTLAAIIIPAGTTISVGVTEIPLQYRLSIKQFGPGLRVGVKGQVAIAQSGEVPEQVSYSSPRSILLKPGTKEIDVDINLFKESKPVFSRQLLVDSLSLFQVDEHINEEHSIVRSVSTIRSGTLYFESLGGKERMLRAGQQVRFEASEGEVRTLDMKDGQIAFAFHGRVRGMTTGSDKNRISLMPTYLDWLSARHGLSLLWGTTLYLFGIILGIMRWWKAPA